LHPRGPPARGARERGRRLSPAEGLPQPHRGGDAQRPVRPLGHGGHWNRGTLARPQSREEEGVGPRLVSDLPELRVHHLGEGLVPHLSLLAHRAQSARVPSETLLRPRTECAPTPRPRAGRDHHQGVRTAGLRHPRVDTDGARVAGRLDLPARRPGDPVPAPEQGGERMGRRLPALARGGVTTMADALLPPEFSDLEPFAEDWCLASEPERYAKRLSSTMDEMQAFYDSLFPRAEAAIAYLEKFPLYELPDDANRRLQLLHSLILVSFPVEIWRQPYIPDTGTSSFELKEEPVP